MITKYNKGKSTRLTLYKEVEVEADFGLDEIIEGIIDDEEALSEFRKALEANGIPESDDPFKDSVLKLSNKLRWLSLEDETILKDLIKKYESII